MVHVDVDVDVDVVDEHSIGLVLKWGYAEEIEVS